MTVINIQYEDGHKASYEFADSESWSVESYADNPHGKIVSITIEHD